MVIQFLYFITNLDCQTKNHVRVKFNSAAVVNTTNEFYQSRPFFTDFRQAPDRLNLPWLQEWGLIAVGYMAGWKVHLKVINMLKSVQIAEDMGIWHGI